LLIEKPIAQAAPVFNQQSKIINQQFLPGV
jgi:hypothetical protein